jgi:hypothetical protein
MSINAMLRHCQRDVKQSDHHFKLIEAEGLLDLDFKTGLPRIHSEYEVNSDVILCKSQAGGQPVFLDEQRRIPGPSANIQSVVSYQGKL